MTDLGRVVPIVEVEQKLVLMEQVDPMSYCQVGEKTAEKDDQDEKVHRRAVGDCSLWRPLLLQSINIAIDHAQQKRCSSDVQAEMCSSVNVFSYGES